MNRPYLVVIGALLLGLLAPSAYSQEIPKYSAEVPASIMTPDNVQTRIGTLKFADGLPDAETVQKVYDQLDFGRGVEAFMAGMPAASVQALKAGFVSQGFGPNQAMGITETLADARQLFLTPNATTVYVWFCFDVKDGPMVVQVPPAYWASSMTPSFVTSPISVCRDPIKARAVSTLS